MAADDAVLKAVLSLEDIATKTLQAFGQHVSEQEKRTVASAAHMDEAFKRLGLDVRQELGGIGKAMADQQAKTELAARAIETSFQRLSNSVTQSLGGIREQIRLAKQGTAEFGQTLGALGVALGPTDFDLNESLRGLGVAGFAAGGQIPQTQIGGGTPDASLALLGLANLAQGAVPAQTALTEAYDATRESLDQMGIGLYRASDAVAATDKEFRTSRQGTADYGRTLGVVSLEAKKTADHFSGLAASALAFGKSLIPQLAAIAGVGSVVGIAGKGIGDALAVDEQIARIASVSEDAARSVQPFREEIEKLSRELGRPSTEVARGAYVAIKEAAGDAQRALVLLNGGARLARATMSETGAGVTAVATALDGLGLEISADTVPRMVDMLTVLTRISEAELPEFTSQLARLLIPARQAGFEFEEVAAAIATLQAAGQPTRTVFTQLQGILTSIVEPTEEAREAAKALGIDLSEAHVKAVGFAGILEELGEVAEADRGKLGQLFSSFGALTGATELATTRSEGFKDSLDKLKNSAGENEKAIDRATSSGVKLGEEMNRLKLAMQDFGSGALAALEPVVGALASIVEGAGSALKAIREAAPEAGRGFGTVSGQESLPPGYGSELPQSSIAARELERLLDTLRTKIAGVGKITQAEFGQARAELALYLSQLKQIDALIAADPELAAFTVDTRSLEEARELVVQLSIELGKLADAGRAAAAVTGTFVGGTDEGLRDSALRIELMRGEFNAARQFHAALEQQELAWIETAEKAHEAGEIGIDALNREKKAAEEVTAQLQRLAALQAERVQLAKDLQDAILEDRGLDSFRAQWNLLVQELRPGALGARAAADAFGVLTGSIEGLSRDLVRGEASFKSFARGVGQEIAALIVKFALLRAASGIFGAFATPATGGFSGAGGFRGGHPGFDKGGIFEGSMLGHATVPRAFAEQLTRHAIPVRGYDRGGIADTPQIAVFGRHGRSQAEAFVPLGGDRKIPVKIQGDAGGGRHTVVHAPITLNVASLDPRTAADAVLAQMPEIKRGIASAIESGQGPGGRALVQSVRHASRHRG